MSGQQRPVSKLEEAFLELEERYYAADEAGDWKEASVLSPLVTVADYLRRISASEDAPYRADNVRLLVAAAIELQQAAFDDYAGWPEGDRPAAEAISQANAVLAMTQQAAALVMRRAAQWEVWGDPPRLYASQAAWLSDLPAVVSGWVEQLTEETIHDPEEQ